MELESYKYLLTWFQQHPEWSSAAAFLLSFMESIAIIGLIVPGSIILALIGLLIGAGVLPFGNTLFWLIAGAYVGDLTSYWLGRHYRARIRDLWPFRLFPQWFDKGQVLLRRYGITGLILGRFIGPTRPLLPVIVALMEMAPVRFLIIDLIAVMIWAPIFLLPGILLGTASLATSPEMATRIIIFLVITLFTIWLMFWFIKWTLYKIASLLDHYLQQLWQYFQRKLWFQPFAKLLQKTPSPDDHTQLSLAVFFLLFFVLFTTLALAIVSHNHFAWLNDPIYHLMRSFFNSTFQSIMVGVTLLGDIRFVLVMSAIVFLALFSKLFSTSRAPAWHWLALLTLATGLSEILKHLIISPRPPGLLAYYLHTTPYIPTNSFPSGHVTGAIVFYGFLAVLIAQGRQLSARVSAYTVAALIVGFIAFSRLYLGAHWCTDIIGAILLGVTLILLVTISYRRASVPKISIKFLLVILITMLCAWTGIMGLEYSKNLTKYTPYWPLHMADLTKWPPQGLTDKPLYITNRFGEPLQTINIAWKEDLSHIEKTLSQQGWVKKPKGKILATLGYLSNNSNLRTPLLATFYEDQPSVLVMAKAIDKQILLLKLWRGFASANNQSLEPIWVGTLSYHRHRRPLLRLHGKATNPIFMLTAIDAFTPYLQDFSWHYIRAPYLKLNKQQDSDWSEQILLISSAKTRT